jgi:hypothetical protein
MQLARPGAGGLDPGDLRVMIVSLSFLCCVAPCLDSCVVPFSLSIQHVDLRDLRIIVLCRLYSLSAASLCETKRLVAFICCVASHHAAVRARFRAPPRGPAGDDDRRLALRRVLC